MEEQQIKQDEMNNPSKKWPIIPEQLTTFRCKCQYCDPEKNNGPERNTRKCAHCGMATSKFVRSSLLSLFENLRSNDIAYPIVLVEKVKCSHVEEIPEYETAVRNAKSYTDNDGCSPFIKMKIDQKQKNDGVSYYLRLTRAGTTTETTEVYCVTDLMAYYESLSSLTKFRCTKRKHDIDFDKECVQSDLSHAAGVLTSLQNGQEPKKEIYKYIPIPQNLETDPNSSDSCKAYSCWAYAYICNRSHLTELVFPIYVDKHCSAVLIVGQIPNCGKCQNNNLTESSDCVLDQSDCVDISETVKTLAPHIDTFIDRMNNRNEMRKNDFLYGYLAAISKRIEDERKAKKGTRYLILDVYQTILKDFNIRSLKILTSTSERGKNSVAVSSDDLGQFENQQVTSEVYESLSQWILNDGNQSSGENTKTEIESILSILTNVLERKVQPEQSNEVDFFTRGELVVNQLTFILVVIEWKGSKDENAGIFFQSLNAQLFSLLTTDAAIHE